MENEFLRLSGLMTAYSKRPERFERKVPVRFPGDWPCTLKTNKPELWSTYQKPEPVVLSNEKLTKIEAGLSLTLPKYALHLGY